MRKARVDTTAASLTALARQMGALVLPLNGTLDALIQTRRGTLFVVDWKGQKTPMTAAQVQLLLHGWKIHFISTPEELRALVMR